jgi:hypothetical protein
MASGRVPNTVSTFTSILFELSVRAQPLTAAVVLNRAAAG